MVSTGKMFMSYMKNRVFKMAISGIVIYIAEAAEQNQHWTIAGQKLRHEMSPSS